MICKHGYDETPATNGAVAYPCTACQQERIEGLLRDIRDSLRPQAIPRRPLPRLRELLVQGLHTAAQLLERSGR